MWPSILFSLCLLAGAAGLMAWHVRAWQATQREKLDARELLFRHRQFRRRTQTSAMLGILAVALSAGRLITGPAWLVLLFWGGVVLMVGWAGLLAAVDAWATKCHFDRLRQQLLLEQAKLQGELRRHSGGSRGEEAEGRIDGNAS